MREIEARLSNDLPSDIVVLTKALPDLDASKVKVYFLPSFYHFEGQTHDLGAGTAVLFGVDVLSKSPDVNLGVIVAHELYHIYQFQTNPDLRTNDSPLWKSVWIEGSAAYASQVLTPGATEAQALSPKFVDTSSATVAQLACPIASQWDTRDPRVAASYLDVGQHPPGLPPAGGYLIGYLVSASLAKTYTVAQLAKLPDATIEPLMRKHVDELCTATP